MASPYTENVATLPVASTANARNLNGDKELVERKVLVVADGDELRQVIDARWWMGRSANASVVYCSIWVRGKAWDAQYAGRGSAGGGGYHKQSAAFDDACRSAGITLAKRIDGAGDSAVEAAMHAIANAVGYADCHVRGIV